MLVFLSVVENIVVFCPKAVIGVEPAVKYSFASKSTETRRKGQYKAEN